MMETTVFKIVPRLSKLKILSQYMNKRIYIRKHGCVNRNYSVNLLPKNLMFVVHCAMLFGSPLCQESMWWTRILPSTWAVPVAEALVLFANRLLSFKLLLSGFVMSFWLYTCVCAVWPLHPSLKQVRFRQRFYTESLGMRMPFSLQNWRDVQECDTYFHRSFIFRKYM